MFDGSQCLKAAYGSSDILDPDGMVDEINCINLSPYYNASNFPIFLKNEGHFNGLSLGARIISAKLDA